MVLSTASYTLATGRLAAQRTGRRASLTTCSGKTGSSGKTVIYQCGQMYTNTEKLVKKKYKAVWALRLTDMSKDYVTLLSLNLLLCLHLLNISERLLMLVRKSAFKIANLSSKHRLQDLAPLD